MRYSDLRAKIYHSICDAVDGRTYSELCLMWREKATSLYAQNNTFQWRAYNGYKHVIADQLQSLRKDGLIRYDKESGSWYNVNYSPGSILLEVLHKRGVRFSELGVTGSWNDVADEFIARWKKGGREV